MGKRNIRIPSRDILKKIELLEGKVVHLITLSGETFTGTCSREGKTGISITDGNAMWYNRKKHIHSFKLTEISEIIFDQVTDY